MAYRQTNTLRPTEEQFKELFDLQINTFWKYKAYTWYDPQLVFESPEDMRDKITEWSLAETQFYQMFWEDETLLGFRAFMPCSVVEDSAHAMINSAGLDGPIPKILGDDFYENTLRTDIFIGRPGSTGNQNDWMFDRPEMSPTWDAGEGESLHQAIIDNGFKHSYSIIHGKIQKQRLWAARNKLTGIFARDIYLQNGYSYREKKILGFDVNEQDSFIYRLVGGESLGWPPIHPLYHVDNAPRPDVVPRPYMATIDDPERPPEAPMLGG